MATQDGPDVDAGDEDVFAGYFLERAGINLNYILFPGLILHEFSHYLACKLAGLRVYEVVWWSPKGGHVAHQRARGTNSVIISLAPFFVNNALALIALATGLKSLGEGDGMSAALWLWLGVSFGVFAVPSGHDLLMSLHSLRKAYRNDRRSGSVVIRLASMIAYPIWYFLQSVLVYLLLPIARVKTLRILWVLLLFYLLTTGVGSTLML
jgi:hypothetical protein